MYFDILILEPFRSGSRLWQTEYRRRQYSLYQSTMAGHQKSKTLIWAGRTKCRYKKKL